MDADHLQHREAAQTIQRSESFFVTRGHYCRIYRAARNGCQRGRGADRHGPVAMHPAHLEESRCPLKGFEDLDAIFVGADEETLATRKVDVDMTTATRRMSSSLGSTGVLQRVIFGQCQQKHLP